MNFEKLLAQRVFANPKSIGVILFRDCPSVPYYSMFALLFIPSINALRIYQLVHSIWWQFYLAVTISNIQLDLPTEAHDENNTKDER